MSFNFNIKNEVLKLIHDDFDIRKAIGESLHNAYYTLHHALS